MDDEAPKWAIVEEDGGGRAASVVNTGAANATEATWECPSRFLPLPLRAFYNVIQFSRLFPEI